MATRKNRLQTQQGGESITRQSFQKECNINNIMSKYQKTGVIQHIARNEQRYADVTAPDFKKAMDMVTETTQLFESLPSTVRKEFNHDPSEFLDAIQNPTENKEVLTQLGFLNPDPEEGVPGSPGQPAEVSTADVSSDEKPKPQS